MGKHRFRNKIKSIVGSLVDPDKDEELKGSNIETEDNYKKIIELLNEENEEDKNKLLGLIEQFHNRYQSIYQRYDDITGKLKEKVNSKKEKNSSSSDSDSDDSSSKNGKGELQLANTEIEELKRILAVEIEEKQALISQLVETENMLNESKHQNDKLHEENLILNREKKSLIMEKETDMTTIEELRAIIVEFKGEKENFDSELQEVRHEFLEKLKTKEDEVSNLIKKVEITELDNENVLIECSQLREKLYEKEAELLKQIEMHDSIKKGIVESLRFEKNEIEKKKEDEILALQIDLTEKINNLQKELESLSAQKLESDNEIERLQDEIMNKNGDQERLMEEKEIKELRIEELEKKIEEISKEIENGLESKEQIVEQLEETIEDLKSDLEIKGDEVNMLTETVRNLEVKIRLANQKLRVTEQMLNETEHEHATKEEKLHQENKSLMDKISILSQTIVAIKREVQEKVNEALTGVDSLTVKFEEDYGHVTTRVYEITNEIQAARVHLKKVKEDMKQEVEKMVVKLQVCEGENEKLMMVIVKKDEKIKELEDTILVKDEWISGLGDDKREAIKQLCIWADYQRDRCDDLQELVLKKTVGARRQTVR